MAEEITNEIWKDIPGYENLYQISSMGKVKSLRRTVKYKNGAIHIVNEKILKPSKDREGYLRIFLCKEGINKNMLVHRLVCESFLKNPYNLPEVNHRNEIKTDNRLENLEYCDRKYNVNYGTGNERRAKELSKVKKGVYNTKKSKPVKCLENGKIYPSISEVHRQFGFSQGNICECCNKKRKSAYKLHWEWAE